MTPPPDEALRQNLIAARERLNRDPDMSDDMRAERAAALEELTEQATAARWAAAIPSRFLWARLADFNPTEIKPVLDWTERPDGRNLVLAGAVGCGKTYLATAASRPLLERGLDVVFAPLVELLDRLRPGGETYAFEDLCHADVLVLDDLGAERPTDWTAERLYALVNRRWLEERPTVATTNLMPSELEGAVGPRVFSRLVGNDAVVLEMGGTDRRRIRGGLHNVASGKTAANPRS